MISDDDEILNSTKATWLTSRGNHYGSQKKYQEALADFQEAIMLKSDHLPAYFGIAVAYKEIIEKAPDEMKLHGKIIAKKEDALKKMSERPPESLKIGVPPIKIWED
jgi:tetratricopeptide (TPR) repeat protein